jgi:hypothetical protein
MHLYKLSSTTAILNPISADGHIRGTCSVYEDQRSEHTKTNLGFLWSGY